MNLTICIYLYITSTSVRLSSRACMFLLSARCFSNRSLILSISRPLSPTANVLSNCPTANPLSNRDCGQAACFTYPLLCCCVLLCAAVYCTFPDFSPKFSPICWCGGGSGNFCVTMSVCECVCVCVCVCTETVTRDSDATSSCTVFRTESTFFRCKYDIWSKGINHSHLV